MKASVYIGICSVATCCFQIILAFWRKKTSLCESAIKPKNLKVLCRLSETCIVHYMYEFLMDQVVGKNSGCIV